MNEPAGAEHAGLRAYTPLRPTGEPGYAEPSGLREYAQLLWRKKVIVLVVAAICVVGTLGYCLVVKPTYQATASVLLEPPISQTLIQANFPTSVTAVPNVPDGIEVIESANVADRRRQDHPGAPSVTATQVGTTDVVQISVRSKNPHLASGGRQRLCHGVHPLRAAADGQHLHRRPRPSCRTRSTRCSSPSRTSTHRSRPRRPAPTSRPTRPSSATCRTSSPTLQDQLQNYQFYSSQGVTTEVGQVISSATVPAKPVSPKTLEWTVLALIFGLILGVGVALLVNAVAPRPRLDF